MFSISYEQFRLSNGLDVILHQDRSLPLVAVNVWYHVGSKDEDVGRTGFAHLFEHIMFEGSKHHDRSYFEPLQKIGANLNGSTSADRTNYWETVPANYLELALWLEADRMGFLLDALDQERFDVQRDVVKNERRQSYENRPYGLSRTLLQPALFPLPHPYNWMTIGSAEDLDNASLDDVKAFFQRYYAPSNASLAIAGHIETHRAMQLVERYFGGIAPGPPIRRIGRMDSELRGAVSLTMRDRVHLPRLYLAWPTVPMFDADQPALDVLGAVLSDGRASRLYRLLVHDKQIARDVEAGQYAQEIAGEFHLRATASPGRGLDEIEAVTRGELDRIRREPPTDAEMARARNRLITQHVHQLEGIGGFGGRADQLNLFKVFANDPNLVNTIIDRYLEVTGEDLSRVAGELLAGSCVRLQVHPEEPLKPSAQAIDRSAMPRPASEVAYSPPVPIRRRLANGLQVLHVEKPEFPMVAMGVIVRAGASTDPTGQPGLAHITGTMLQEGTESRSSDEIAEAMEFLGSEILVNVSREHALISAQTVTGHWRTALEIIADITRRPSFPEGDFDRVRRRRLTDLRRVADDPTAIASRASRALLYGPDSPYGHPATGTERSIADLDRADLLGHFEAWYGPQSATLIVVGQVTEREVAAEAERLFGGWRSNGDQPATASGAPEAGGAPTTIFLADKPGAVQSVIRAGQLTIPRSHPDYFAMTLMNYVLGGQFSGRLNMNLREDKGYSYGYLSAIDWATGPSGLVAGGAVQTEVTRQAIAETLRELGDVRERRPVTSEEFRSAVLGICRGFPSQFESLARTAVHLSQIALFDLPDTYFSDYVANVQAVSIEEVRRVASERIDDERLKILVVGDRGVIEPELAALGLPIVPVDHDGRDLS